MIPYDGTPIKDELIRTGRLKGDICHPDYDFLDPLVDAYFHRLNEMVHVSGWIHGIGALTVQLQYVKGEVAVLGALFPPLDGFREYRETVRAITASANEVLFRVVEDLLGEYREERTSSWTPGRVKEECVDFHKILLQERDAFVARHQAILMQALKKDESPSQLVPA